MLPTTAVPIIRNGLVKKKAAVVPCQVQNLRSRPNPLPVKKRQNHNRIIYTKQDIILYWSFARLIAKCILRLRIFNNIKKIKIQNSPECHK